MSPKMKAPTRAEKMEISRMEAALRKEKGVRREEILNLFAETPKTETAFYLQFQQLSQADKEYIQTYQNLPDADWSVFKAITRYWSVRTA